MSHRSVQMVDLVLEHTGEAFAGLNGHAVAIKVQADEVDATGARYRPNPAPEGKTSLVGARSSVVFGYHRVDDGAGFPPAAIDEQSQPTADLRGRQPNSAAVPHRSKHHCAQIGDLAVDVHDVQSRQAQNRIAIHADLQPVLCDLRVGRLVLGHRRRLLPNRHGSHLLFLQAVQCQGR